jgi:hypothetical protein
MCGSLLLTVGGVLATNLLQSDNKCYVTMELMIHKVCLAMLIFVELTLNLSYPKYNSK